MDGGVATKRFTIAELCIEMARCNAVAPSSPLVESTNANVAGSSRSCIA